MFPSACRGRDIAGVGRGWVMQRWVWLRRWYRERREGARERSFWAVWGGEGVHFSSVLSPTAHFTSHSRTLRSSGLVFQFQRLCDHGQVAQPLGPALPSLSRLLYAQSIFTSSIQKFHCKFWNFQLHSEQNADLGDKRRHVLSLHTAAFQPYKTISVTSTVLVYKFRFQRGRTDPHDSKAWERGTFAVRHLSLTSREEGDVALWTPQRVCALQSSPLLVSGLWAL